MRALLFSFGAIAVGLTVLSGCESAEQKRDATQTYLARALSALRDCNEEYPKRVVDKAVLRSQCQNRALDVLRPRYPFPDLLDTFQADRMSISEKFRRRQISAEQASEELLAFRRQMALEEQKRSSARSDGIEKVAVEAVAIVAIGQLICEKTARGMLCF